MKSAGPISRSVGMTLTLAFFGGASACGQTTAASASTTSPQNDHAAPTITLAPEVQKKLDAFLDKMKTGRGDYWQSKLDQEADEITKATGLSDQGHQALQAASKQAVADSMKAWTPKMPDEVLRQLASVPKDQLLAQLDQAMTMLNQAQMEDALRMQFGGDMSAPDQQDSWKTALHQVLTPAQLDAWTQKQSTQKSEAEKQIADILKNGADRTQAEETNEIMAECKGIENALKLPPDRAAKLEALGKSAVDRTVELFRKQEETALLAMGEDQRRPLTRNGFYMGLQPDSQPTALPVWKDGLAQLLTSQEQAQLQAARDSSKTRRQHVMAQVMVMLLDEKLALTEAQRQKLEPIADRLVKDVAQLYPQGAPGNYAFISNDVFYGAATKATDAEMKPILDTVQLKRWHNLSNQDSASDATDATAVAATTDSQPEAVEKAISSFFYEKTENERKRELEANTLKAEDVARVASLNAASTERLQAAARGATEQSLMTWKWFTEQQIRSQLQGLTPQNVNQRLQSLQDLFFQRQFQTSNRMDIWDQTLQTELTTDQQDAWKQETDAREHYRQKAIAAAVLAEFDRQAHLTDEQWNKLDPLVAGVLTDYSEGIAQVFSGMNGMAWYMGGPYVLIPLMGVEDQDLKSILTKDQMDLWTASQQFANATNFWQMIKQMHTPQKIRRTARTVIVD